MRAERPLQTGAVGALSWAEILAQAPAEALQTLNLKTSPFWRMGKHAVMLFCQAVFAVYGTDDGPGIENLPSQGPYIIAPNHASYADAPLMMAAVPWRIGSRTYFLGATQFFGGPITSRIAKAMNVIPVDMDAKTVQRAATVGRCFAKIQDPLRVPRGRPVI